MEATASLRSYSRLRFFKFSPTDEELILYYLKRKIEGFHQRCEDVIREIDIIKHEPWDLPEKSAIPSNNEWYFFSPRGRKYLKGCHVRLATQFGYWKATGKERDVKSGSRIVGSRRTLVFHKGRAPRGKRTEWMMHEYCMSGTPQESFVLCRVRNRKNCELKCNDIPPIELNQSLTGESSTCPSVSNLQQKDNDVEHMDTYDSEYDEIPGNFFLQRKCRSPLKFQGDEDVTDDSCADMSNDDIMMLDESSFANPHGNGILNEEFMDFKFQQYIEGFRPASPTSEATSPPRIIIRSRKENKPRKPLPFQGTAPRRIRMKCQCIDEPSVEASCVRDEMYQDLSDSAEFPRCFITKMLDVTVNHQRVTVLIVLFLLVWCFWLVHEFCRGKLQPTPDEAEF